MLLTVKKQVEETVELKTPSYYRGLTGHHFINESGVLISVNSRMVSMWSPADGKYHVEEIERMLRNGTPCEKEEFDKAYMGATQEIQSAVNAVEI